MKQILTITLLAISLSLYAQGDVLQMIYTVNGQPERIEGYSKIETIIYGESYDEGASIDTVVTDLNGNKTELTLQKRKVVVFGNEYDMKYEIDIATGDTSLITKTTYNKQGKIATQSEDYGSDAAAMFNSSKVFTYDDQGRVTSVTNSVGGEESGGVFTYHADGLPESISMSMGMGKFNINREEKDDHIRFTMTGEMSPEMLEMFASMGKDPGDMPQEFFELRKKNGLHEIKHMKEEGKEKTLTLQSITMRDKEGKIHDQMKYSGGEVFEHKKYTYIDDKLMSISNPLEETNYKIDYDEQGNQLIQYDDYSKTTMTYNEDGMTTSRASGPIFSNEIGGLEIIKYLK